MGNVETVGIVVGDGLAEQFHEFGLGGFGRRGRLVTEHRLEREEHLVELHFTFTGEDGDVREGGDAAGGREDPALLRLEVLGDGAAARLGDIVEKAMLAGYGKEPC